MIFRWVDSTVRGETAATSKATPRARKSRKVCRNVLY
jgi:hypothetical protein